MAAALRSRSTAEVMPPLMISWIQSIVSSSAGASAAVSAAVSAAFWAARNPGRQKSAAAERIEARIGSFMENLS